MGLMLGGIEGNELGETVRSALGCKDGEILGTSLGFTVGIILGITDGV